ncbi:MAG: threonine--tRNA ligase [Thermoplasmata archaeon]
MKLLFIHSDYIEYNVRERATKIAEEYEKDHDRVEEVLVVFVSVERNDKINTADNAAIEIDGVAKQINVKRIFIYPYAHLSSDLASPETAINILNKLRENIKDMGYEMHTSPFGWYKSFKISCKGHPLSELSKTISEYEEPEALKNENKLKTSWYILNDGILIDVDKFDYTGYENLKTFVEYEISGTRAVHEMPPHVKYMKTLEIAGYEEGSDAGNLRYFPKGKLIKSLIENYVTERVLNYGAQEVETPIMYDYNHPALKSYLERFPARQYTVLSGEDKFFLRFSACFGQFLIAKDATISYKQLPLRLYELTRYSFRREKHGELVGLRRLRAFTMPDMHTFVADLDNAKEEFMKQYMLSIDVLKAFGLDTKDYEVAIRFTREFYENNKDFIYELQRRINKPVLIQIWEEKFFYFILKFEFNFVDNTNKAAALSTVQIDVDNSRRFNITYINERNERIYPLILHCSPSGAVERVIYAMLEKAEKDKRNNLKPMFPVWLSPTIVRIIPLDKKHYEYSEVILNELRKNKIRADFDDREISLSKKIREAEMDWIPYIAVIGDKEISSNILTIRERNKNGNYEISLEEFIKTIKEKISDYPYRDLNESQYLSKRVKFT